MEKEGGGQDAYHICFLREDEQGRPEGEQETSAWEGQMKKAAIEVRQSHRRHQPEPASLPHPHPVAHITYESPRAQKAAVGEMITGLPLQSAPPLKTSTSSSSRGLEGTVNCMLLAPGILSVRDYHGFPPSALCPLQQGAKVPLYPQPSSRRGYARFFPGGSPPGGRLRIQSQAPELAWGPGPAGPRKFAQTELNI